MELELVAILARVKELVSATVCTIEWRGNILKARIVASTGANPVVGDTVIAEHLPLSSEWYIVAIVPPP